MIIDKQAELGLAQAITASAASTDYHDAGAARDLGQFEGLEVLFTVTEAFVSAGASTLVVTLQSDNDSAFGSATDLASSKAIAKDDLIVGYQFLMKIPAGVAERYLRAYFTVAVANFSAGKMTTQIIKGAQLNRHYADAL